MHLKRTFFAVKEKPRNSFSWLILYFPGAKYMLGLTIKSGRPTYSLGCHVMICSILDDIIFLLRKKRFRSAVFDFYVHLLNLSSPNDLAEGLMEI